MFTFEFLIPANQKEQAKQILKSAGYAPQESRGSQGISLEVNLGNSGEKRFVQKKLKDAGLYFEVIREESDDAKKKKIKRAIALINKNKKATAEWDEWESKYDFNFSEADSYDLANAKTKANKLIKKFDLKESLKESTYEEIMDIPDPELRYQAIYTGISNQSIDYSEFTKIMKGIASDEFTFMNDDFEGKPTDESEQARQLIKNSLGEQPGYFFFADQSDVDAFNIEFTDEASDAFWFTLTNSDDLDIQSVQDLENFIGNN